MYVCMYVCMGYYLQVSGGAVHGVEAVGDQGAPLIVAAELQRELARAVRLMWITRGGGGDKRRR